jgi:hypothetical protein
MAYFHLTLTIMLYNTCHYLLTFCEASRGHFGNLVGPVLTLYRCSLYTSPVHVSTFVASRPSLASFPSPGFSPTSSGSHLHLPSKPLQRLASTHVGLRLCRDSLDFAQVVPSKVMCLFSWFRFFMYHLRPVLMRLCGNSFLVSSRVDHTPNERRSRASPDLRSLNFDHFLNRGVARI